MAPDADFCLHPLISRLILGEIGIAAPYSGEVKEKDDDDQVSLGPFPSDPVQDLKNNQSQTKGSVAKSRAA